MVFLEQISIISICKGELKLPVSVCLGSGLFVFLAIVSGRIYVFFYAVSASAARLKRR